MEGCLNELPCAIDEAEIPETFPVSVVARANACFSKVVLSSGKKNRALRPGPRALLGRMTHDLIEEAILGFRFGKEATMENLEWVLDRFLTEARRQLESDHCTAHCADLTSTMSPMTWSRKRRSMLDLAYEMGGKSRNYTSPPPFRSYQKFHFENLNGEGRWIEVPIEVVELRLKGRIDVMERSGTNTKIIDIKSGRIEGNGTISEDILRQIRLYGIMAKHIDNERNIHLAINDGEERAIPFDSEVRKEILDWLRSKTHILPVGSRICCNSIANVGPECRWCDMRHLCGSYLREAPALWNQELNWRLPLDIWGIIEGIKINGEGLFDLILMDEGGRRVKLFRIRDVHLEDVDIGQRLFFFSLSASPIDLKGNTYRHPVNFYELPDNHYDMNRAWALQVFSEGVR